MLFLKKNELSQSGKKLVNLADGAPLFKFDYYINYAKSLILGLLTTFTLFEHFDYPCDTSDGWFREIPPKDKKLVVKWGKKWLPVNKAQIEGFSTSKMYDKIEEMSPLEYYKTFAFNYNKIKFSSDTQEKLDKYFALETPVKELFNSTITYFLHANHIEKDFPSLAIVSLVNSIENLVNYEHRDSAVEQCNECGQKRFRVTKKFNDFLDVNLDGFYSRKEIKDLIGDIYSKRSKIVHTGKLYKSEKNKPIWEGSLADSMVDIIISISVTRISINSWIERYGL